jgi:hypothetical protein
MKSLKDILLESKKTYPFKIGVAGELPEGFNERLRTALEKFTIDSLSSGKKTPIQEHPLDFPQLSNMEVTFWDVELKYPTTEYILREYLGTVCSVHVSHIVVKNPNSPLSELDEKSKDETYEVLLTSENMGGTSAQQSVGNNRVMDLLKELEAVKKERGEESFIAETPKQEPQNKKSTIGS